MSYGESVPGMGGPPQYVTIDQADLDRLVDAERKSNRYRALLIESGINEDYLYQVLLGDLRVVFMGPEQFEDRKTSQRPLRAQLDKLSRVTKHLEIRLGCDVERSVFQQLQLEELTLATEQNLLTDDTITHEIFKSFSMIEHRLQNVLHRVEDGVTPLCAASLDLAIQSKNTLSVEDIAKGRGMLSFIGDKSKSLEMGGNQPNEQMLAEAVFLGLHGPLKEAIDFPEQGVKGMLMQYNAVYRNRLFVDNQIAILRRWQAEGAKALQTARQSPPRAAGPSSRASATPRTSSLSNAPAPTVPTRASAITTPIPRKAVGGGNDSRTRRPLDNSAGKDPTRPGQTTEVRPKLPGARPKLPEARPKLLATKPLTSGLSRENAPGKTSRPHPSASKATASSSKGQPSRFSGFMSGILGKPVNEEQRSENPAYIPIHRSNALRRKNGRYVFGLPDT